MPNRKSNNNELIKSTIQKNPSKANTVNYSDIVNNLIYSKDE